jgi:4-amino-4-deoxy-L-arabinose transferase-like glycosyltransferase
MIRKKKLAWQHVLLAALLAASLLLHFWSLEKEGYSNPYYAAAVKGMLDSPSAFFYGSFDSGLYVTVDKPAFGLWLEALSARAFGVNSFGLILPSALAGTLCVLLMFFIVRKKWGDTAGVVAAGVMAFTPILVALSRTNNLDMLLLFFLLCGTLLMQKAVDKRSLPLYFAAMACVGVGFNIKMLQAFLVVPAFVLWYLLGSGKWLKKILHTALALVVLVAVSFSWALAVDLTPASERPYVGGSDDNSVVELALGYNGLSRLLGPQRDRNAQAPDGGLSDETLPPDRPARQPPNDPPAGADIAPRSGGGVGGASENGEKGVFRLFDAQLGGLASWFLPPALGMAALGGAGALLWFRKRKSKEWTQEKTEALRQTLFWAAWLLPMVVFFSVAGFMHRYYVVMTAPAVAALSAICAVRAWRSERSRLLVPLAVLLTLAVQCVFVLRSSWIWLVLPILAGATIAVLLFLIGKKTPAAVLLALALFTAPIAWSLTPVIGTMNSHIPDVGPDVLASVAAEREDLAADELTKFVTEHYNGERWALAVPSANAAAPIILETGLPVMAVGGFSGGDDILTVDALKEYIASGSIRYFWIAGQQTKGEVYRWVRQHGTAIRLSARVTIFDLAGTVSSRG